jgi:diguanylate cyclase (GGDEF)-like protein/PAS domain S-box-containing protein
MVYRCDNDRRWTMRYASQAAERLTGYPPKALIGNAQVAYGDLICPDDRERVWETVQRAVKTASVFQVEYRLVRRDGVMVSVWEQGRAIEDPDDPGRQVIEGLMLDVTERVLAESVAQEAAERLETLGDNLPGGAIYRLVRDPAGLYQFTYASRGIEQVLGVSRDRILADAQAAFGLTEPPYADGLAEANERSARDLSVFNVELPLRLKDERRKWIAVRSMPRAMPDGSVLWDGVVTDITSQKEVALEAMEARATLETALASMGDAVMISDAKGHIIHRNAAFARFHRFERLADCPRQLDAYSNLLDVSFADGSPSPVSQWAIPRALRGETATDQTYRLRRKDTGESWIASYSLAPIRGADGQIIGSVVTGRDVTQERVHQEELDRIAHHDPLTGLPNRRLLTDRLEQAIALADRSGTAFAVCYLDLDGFKPINDRYGHETGDRFLVEVAAALRAILRAHDTVARLGGDEFVLLLTQLQQPEDCFPLLQRILSRISQPIVIDEVTHGVTGSLGVTLYPGDAVDPDTLLRHADQAMYHAKEAGRNRYQFYDPAQGRAVQALEQLQQQLRQALARGELLLYYQPQVDLISREVTGVEALIRWQHPEQGLLPPAAFMPAIEGGPLEIAGGDGGSATALD